MKKLNQKDAVKSLTQTVGLTAGMMAGGAISNVLPFADQRLSRGVMLVSGIVGSVVFSGKGKQNEIIQSVAQGIAARGAFDLTAGIVKDSISVSDDESMVGKLTQGALGLAAPSLMAEVVNWPERPVVVEFSDAPEYNGLAQVHENLQIA